MNSATLFASTFGFTIMIWPPLAKQRDRREVLHRVVGHGLEECSFAACVVFVVMSTV
jgi:hypothetical protein